MRVTESEGNQQAMFKAHAAPSVIGPHFALVASTKRPFGLMLCDVSECLCVREGDVVQDREKTRVQDEQNVTQKPATMNSSCPLYNNNLPHKANLKK